LGADGKSESERAYERGILRLVAEEETKPMGRPPVLREEDDLAI